MSAKVMLHLSDGITFDLDAELAEFAKHWRRALRRHQFIEVTNSSGHARLVNPHQILYAEQSSSRGQGK